jgi:23S rRNA (cytidine1920-2'-O)/16S rRNA (cytidine1409-2'-O)-methyltransferase
MTKVRLDVLLVERGLAESREKAQALIRAGKVLVRDRRADKPGHSYDSDAELRVQSGLQYVSRGGLKLVAALDEFQVDVEGAVVADIGASTGGFTDCVLQRGASRVYAIDVGYGQLAWKLRNDPRVVVLERTNIRHVTELPELVDLVTVDVSFIGLELVLPVALHLLRPDGNALVLIKPQFEAGRRQVGKGGVVRDPAVHREVLSRILAWCTAHHLAICGLIPSPIRGPSGNVEFLLYLATDVQRQQESSDTLIDQVLQAVDGLQPS